jgi:PAS domain S-box-containing protein
MSDHRLRVLIDSVPDCALLLLDPTGRILDWSAGAQTIVGYAANDIVGRPFDCLFTPEDVAAGQPARDLAAAAAADGGIEQEGWRLRQDGSRFWASVVIRATRRPDGETDGFAMLLRDVSERRRMEAQFSQVVEAVPNAMVMINRAGLIEMVNAQAEGMFGYARAEMLGRPIELLMPVRFQGAHPALHGAFFANPHPRLMGAGRELYAMRKDGSEFPVEIGLNPIETVQGTMVLSAIVDISARKRLEERCRRIVEAAPSAMVMVNAEGCIDMVNAQTERMFGYKRSEMLGQPVEMLVPEQYRGTHAGLRRAFLEAPLPRTNGLGRDLCALRKDGSEFPVEIGLNPIETEQGTMVLSAIVDISERKQRGDRIQAALREKEILLGEIHHRAKNNLQIVYSLLELQSARISDQSVLDMLRDSQNRVRSMALIHQTLYGSNDFAKVDFGRFLDHLVPILTASYSVNTEHVRLAVDVEQVELPIDAAVPCGLVVNELISNALKHAFLPGQVGEISITLKRQTANDVTLCVTDDGRGLSEQLELASTTTLGLQLVTLLTDQLGGELEIHRAHPTSFMLRFPIER